MLTTMTKTEPPFCWIESNGDSKNAMPQNAAVRLANHLPLSKIVDNNMAMADRKARVTKVSAIPMPRATDPLGLHKQQE